MCCCCRPASEIHTAISGGSIQRLLITPHNTLQVQLIFGFGINSFYILYYLYIFKTKVTVLTNKSIHVCLHFSVHVTSQAFESFLNFSLIRAAYTSFSPYSLHSSLQAIEASTNHRIGAHSSMAIENNVP